MSESDRSDDDAPRPDRCPSDRDDVHPAARRPACPVCGGRLIEFRGELLCSVCHRLFESCCEGGPG